MQIFIFVSISALLFLLTVQISTTGIQTQTQPSVLNTKFQVKRFAGDFEPSSMVFLGPDDVLVLDRDEGKVFRVTHGIRSGPLIDVNVATNGYRGLLGVAAVNKNSITNVFLYFTESTMQDNSDKIQGPKDNGGVINIGPDNNIYLIIGDLQGSFRNKQYETMTQNYQNGTKADGRAGILRISQNGKICW